MRWKAQRAVRLILRGVAMGAVLLALLLAVVWLGLAELLVAGLRHMQRDRLGVWPNRLLRLKQRIGDSRERLDAAARIALEE